MTALNLFSLDHAPNRGSKFSGRIPLRLSGLDLRNGSPSGGTDIDASWIFVDDLSPENCPIPTTLVPVVKNGLVGSEGSHSKDSAQLHCYGRRFSNGNGLGDWRELLYPSRNPEYEDHHICFNALHLDSYQVAEFSDKENL